MYATPVPPSLVSPALAGEQVVALLPATYNHLQGYIRMLSHALVAACAQTAPAIHLLSQHETVNKTNSQQLVQEYVEQDPSFAPSRLLASSRLKQIGTTLGAKYVLQPGLAYVTQEMTDKFEAFGFHILRSRVSTIGLWLRLWDVQTGEYLAEVSGEATVAAELLEEGSAVPFHEGARKLWRYMIQEGLLNGKTKSQSFLKNALPFEP
jgi:hypothetical protein